MTQKNTSANTSINKSKLPTAYKTYVPHGIVLDYGCGKYIDHIKQYCFDKGCIGYLPYDKYNQPDDINKAVLAFGRIHGADVIYCCNVLNVIDSDDAILDVLNDINTCMHLYSTAYIQIYEGDKSGIGKVTKADCYQRNEPTSEYIKFITQVFPTSMYSITKTGNILAISHR